MKSFLLQSQILLFFALSFVSCSQKIKNQYAADLSSAELNDQIKLDSVSIFHKRTLGGFYTHYLCSEKPITNQQFCTFLNTRTDTNLRINDIVYQNGRYNTKVSLKDSSCFVPNLSSAQEFLFWLNSEFIKDDNGFNDFSIPLESILNNIQKTEKIKNAITQDKTIAENTDKYLYLVTWQKYQGRSSGIEF